MRLVAPRYHVSTAGETTQIRNTLSVGGNSKLMSARRLWRFVLQKWWIPLIGMITGGTLGFIWGKIQSLEVRRAIKIMVIPDRNETPPPTDILGSLGGIQKFNYDNDIAILKSATLMREVVEELELQGLLYNYNNWPATLVYGSNRLLITKVTGNMCNNNFKIMFDSGLHSGIIRIDRETDEKIRSYKIELDERSLSDTIIVDGGSIIISLTVEGDRIREGKFEYDYRTVPERSGQLLEGLNIIKAQDKSMLLTLEYCSQSCLLNDRILLSLYGLYNKYNQSQKIRRLFEKEKFFLSRIEKVEEELQEIDGKLSSLLIGNPYASAYVEFGSSLINEDLRSRNLIIEGDELTTRVEQALMLICNLGSEESIPYSITELRPIMTEIIDEHNYLIERRSQLIKESSEVSPLVIDLDDAITRRRELVMEYLETLQNNSSLPLSVAKQYNEDIDSMLQRLPDDFARVTHIRRQQIIKENLYQQLLRQREETALLMNDISDRMELVELPYTTDLSGENRVLVFCLGFLLGGLCGVFTVIGRIVISRRIISCSQLEGLGLPIIGEVSKTELSYENTLIKHKSSLYEDNEYREKLTEEFRLIRSNLVHGKNIAKYKATIMITSVDQGCGKTFVALNLAQSFASLGKRVLVIDVNFRTHKGLSEILLSPTYGVSQLLLQSVLSVREFNIASRQINDRLAVLPIGKNKLSALDLLGNERWENIIETYHEEYDIIVLDTVSADVYADARLIGRCSDYNIIVVKIGCTEQDKIKEVMAEWTEEEYKKSRIIVNYSENKNC